MYEKVTDTGVTLRSCHPYSVERLRDRNVAAFLLWSWSWTIRNNIKGLFKKGEW